jgi:hypothetical protein
LSRTDESFVIPRRESTGCLSEKGGWSAAGSILAGSAYPSGSSHGAGVNVSWRVNSGQGRSLTQGFVSKLIRVSGMLATWQFRKSTILGRAMRRDVVVPRPSSLMKHGRTRFYLDKWHRGRGSPAAPSCGFATGIRCTGSESTELSNGGLVRRAPPAHPGR